MSPVAPLRRRRVVAVAALSTVLALGGCADAPSTAPPLAASAVASAHLNQLLGYMQQNALRRLVINWTAFRDTVATAARTAQTIPETYPAVLEALRMLGDGHSSYQIAGGGTLSVPTRTCVSSGAPTPTVPLNVGYVRVGSFGGSGSAATAFAESIQQAIRAQDRADLIGWIVDLRGNGGGNMWPMIAGLGPILGETLLGHFVHPTGTIDAWRYQNGASTLNGIDLVRVAAPYTLINPGSRVAVLVDNGVASSGEATFIAFRGRPATRSFGASTCGASTANQGFGLSNGATLILTTSLMADRALTQYGNAVVPDEATVGPAETVQKALVWLSTP